MKRNFLVALVLLAFASFAVAQIAQPSSDVLGAHLNYGRGCAACHSPHSGTAGNGQGSSGGSGNTILWGEDVSGLYGKTISTDGGKYVEVLPASMSANTPDVSGMLTCLSCHDGNIAPTAMMKNRVYENLPSTYGTQNSIPTLMGTNSAGNYISNHPMGLNATVGCGGTSGWDCTEANGIISMRGSASSRFVSNYGFFVKPGVYNNTAVVVCTTCHDPHAMSAVTINRNSNSGLPPGTYTTTFFLRAPYNPNDTNPMSNQTAQFCRQCHADKSNEMNGGSAGTVF
jgi:cytochrome c553